MANEKKMTKAQMFAQIKANHNLSADEVAFIDHELELLAKKNSLLKRSPLLSRLPTRALAKPLWLSSPQSLIACSPSLRLSRKCLSALT